MGMLAEGLSWAGRLGFEEVEVLCKEAFWWRCWGRIDRVCKSRRRVVSRGLFYWVSVYVKGTIFQEIL